MYTADSGLDGAALPPSHTASSQTRHLVGVTAMLCMTVVISFILVWDALLPATGPLRVGMVSPADIVAPTQAFYISEVRTQREQEAAAANVEMVYTTPDRHQGLKQRALALTITDYIDAVRADSYASPARKAEMLGAIEAVPLSAEAISMTLALPEYQWRRVVTETLQVLDTAMRGELREGQLAQQRQLVLSQINMELSDAQAEVVAALAGPLMVPNSFAAPELTEAARRAAREHILPIEYGYEAGQIVVRRGEIIGPDQFEALEKMGLLRSVVDWPFILGQSLLVCLLMTSLALYVARIHPEVWVKPRPMAAIAVLVTVVTLSAAVMLPLEGGWRYLIPAPAAAMLLGVLLGADLAVMLAVVMALLVGMISGSIEFVLYTFVESVLASLLLHRVERIHDFVRAGVLVGLANLVVILAVGWTQGTSWFELAMRAPMGLTSGIISASLTVAGFYVLSNFLGITTFLQLMELARPTTPLFRELLLKAPGTYHHSIIVSNLAERAAEAIGADPLLVRVGSYYHDVGKTLNPHMYVENQSNCYNPHDALDDPYQSAKLIISHVTEGVKLARKHRLPARIIDFILQHHGTTTVGYFYHQACERHGKEQVSLSDFQYPGPRPQSRETALVLLADTIEAAARAKMPSSVAEIDELVRRLIAKKLGEGQLDDCHISLRDLEYIRNAFVEVLQGVYHPRIQYPTEETQRAVPAVPSALPEGANNGGEPQQSRTPDRRAVGTAS